MNCDPAPYSAELTREIRKNGGWVPSDPFCLLCGDYRSNHATPAASGRKLLCLWAPTYYEEMTRAQWVAKRIAALGGRKASDWTPGPTMKGEI